ncbi:hypothetical protein SLEP1_g5710 [Rubroshorea leprosula]|uniref:BHLH domain-containing protein n=1 Tax=Rubroshorea leprosula TaxID=152421 RepID=A0AAV5HX58_9ROSI|nr:hypothetical protein SLEP1_g5710 [Rubroshorea leprosula]
MRNALPPPVSSQFYSVENDEVQMPNLDVIMQMESKGNVYGDAFSMESKVFSSSYQLNESFSIPYVTPFVYQQDYQSGNLSCDNISQQSSLLATDPAFLQFEWDIKNIQNARKCPVGVSDLLPPLNVISGLVENNTNLNEKKENRKRKVSAFEPQQPYQLMGALAEIREQRLQVPLRRSQKLSDKITTLQKLVSPYGKTDTASVLQEASLYIKLLQEQIQNLYKMLSSSYSSAAVLQTQETGSKEQNLRSRGLCLVPLKFTQKVTKEEQINYNAILRKAITPANF